MFFFSSLFILENRHFIHNDNDHSKKSHISNSWKSSSGLTHAYNISFYLSIWLKIFCVSFGTHYYLLWLEKNAFRWLPTCDSTLMDKCSTSNISILTSFDTRHRQHPTLKWNLIAEYVLCFNVQTSRQFHRDGKWLFAITSPNNGK